jgi:hypothetical protein
MVAVLGHRLPGIRDAPSAEINEFGMHFGDRPFTACQVARPPEGGILSRGFILASLPDQVACLTDNYMEGSPSTGDFHRLIERRYFFFGGTSGALHQTFQNSLLV